MCREEAAILEAARSGASPEWLAEHVAECAECADTLLAAAFLHRQTAAPGPPPAADAIWWRVACERRRAAAERCLRPIAICQKAGTVAAVAVAVALASRLELSGSLLHLAIGLAILSTAAAGSLWLWARRP